MSETDWIFEVWIGLWKKSTKSFRKWLFFFRAVYVSLINIQSVGKMYHFCLFCVFMRVDIYIYNENVLLFHSCYTFHCFQSTYYSCKHTFKPIKKICKRLFYMFFHHIYICKVYIWVWNIEWERYILQKGYVNMYILGVLHVVITHL